MDIAFLNTLQVSDSFFPIGSYTLSNGLESFVQEELLSCSADLKLYVENYIFYMPFNELGFLSWLYKSFEKDDLNTLAENPQIEGFKSQVIEIDNYYSACKSPFEIRKGSMKLCQAFLKIWQKVEELKAFTLYKELIQSKECAGHHLILYGLFSLSKGLDYTTSAHLYAYNTLSAIVTNAVKSVPLSQIDGQIILNKSLEKIAKAVAEAQNIQKEELGISGAGFDMYAMRHENLYSRIYMS